MNEVKTLFLFFLLWLSSSLFSQNLLPDGGFEKVTANNCVIPSQGFNKMQFWYILDATPDLFEKSCPFDESGFIFWDESIEAFEGNNYAGLWSRWNSNATYFTEGIATSLTQPLEAGKTYFFEMAIRNQGTFQGLVGAASGCELNPDRHIDLYVSEDSIRVINDFSNGTSTTSATLVGTLNSVAIQGPSSDGWTQIATCFEASGGEDFFALILPLGTFGDLPPCAETNLGSGIFRSFYYNLDAASITELPKALERNMSACEDQVFEVDLIDLFNFPLLEEATFLWEDGGEGELRNLSKTGTYTILAEIRCATIQLILNILPENCQSNIYVPNAFSPNGDGINDVFQAFLSDGNKIANFQMTIFDRWGAMLFQSTDPSLGWDGKSKNKAVAQGTYTWIINFDITTGEGIKKNVETGGVSLLR